ncbi:hypothetical protein HDU89_004822 [Geranomyces variabilis]|nr:hypothetical protein HDU89_004822 [Geranomyces variabilis]
MYTSELTKSICCPLELLENVEMRFALADTNDRFEKAVATFLPPVLLKLDSPHKTVQTKVMAVCSHVSKRLKSNPEIKVPMSALLDLFSSAKSSVLLRNFCLIYLDLGFARSTKEERVKLLPGLFRDISTRLPAQQATIFQMALQVFGTTGGDFRSLAPKESFDWESHPADLTFLLTKSLDVVLYTFAPAGKPMTALSMGQRSSEPTTPVEQFVPPGISKEAVNFITNYGKASWTNSPTELRSLKLGIIRFISLAESVPEKQNILEKYTIYLAASGDSNHEIVSAGEDGLKRHVKADLEDEQVVKALYLLYQGTGAQRNAEIFRSPATPGLKTRILRVLLKSAAATNQFPQMIQVAFDALNGDLTTAKLRNAGMSFVQWIARMARPEKIKPVAPVLLTALLHFINSPPDTASPDVESLRGFAYEAVGLLCKREPELFDIPLLHQFFTAVSTESHNVRVSVLDALSNMVDAYKRVANDELKRKDLEGMLLQNIDKPDHHARYIAQKYTNTIFPSEYPLARYVNIMLAADLKPEVKEEARRGLEFPDPPTTDEQATGFRAKLPAFTDMCSLLLTKSKGISTGGGGGLRAAGVRRVGAFSADAYNDAIKYLRHLLIHQADPKAVIGRRGVDDLEKISEPTTRAALRELFSKMAVSASASGLQAYIELLETALKSDSADAVLQSGAAFCLLELVSLGPAEASSVYSEKVDWIKTFLDSIRNQTRRSMAHLLGIVATSQIEVPARAQALAALIEEQRVAAADKQARVEQRDGAMLAIGYLVGRLLYRYPSQTFVPSELLAKSVDVVVAGLDAMSPLEVLGALDALSEAGRYAPLPLASDEARKAVVDKLIFIAKNNKDSKIQEEAIATLGQLAHGDHENLGKPVLDFFYSLAPVYSKHVEIQMGIGEAIAAAAFGFRASHMEEHLDIASLSAPKQIPDETATAVLETLLGKLQPGASPPAVRKSCAIWLLCAIKLAGKSHAVVRSNVMRLQNAFAGLLGDADEFTQEVASRGMGLVFELGDEGVRSMLVTSLVSTLTEGKKIAPQSVTGDTQLFRENALGAAPGGDGEKLSGTYASILSLASEMNQPDLVYRFMSLAAHNAIWNSRRGASLGFSTIAAQATRELQPHLPLIVPKLYRFQFDPQPKTAESMKNIWQTLVPEPAKTLDEYFDAIMADLLDGMADRQWRIREASTLALADLAGGQQMERLQPHLERMWVMTFRALDDIKESVRISALKAAKTLTTKTTRFCDPVANPDIKQGARIVAIILPFFLTKGLGSSAEDVRNLSLGTLLKISKKAGILLKPHLTELVGTLLECLSTMEPQVLNYLTFHTDKYNISQEQLENSRLSAVKASPIMEALEASIDQVDVETLTALVPRLTQTIRKGVGLPTKAGAARIVYSLVQRAPSELSGPHADAIVKALASGVHDRSIVVRKAYATAIGQIAKLATDAAVAKLLEQLEKAYLDDPDADDDTRSVAGITIHQFALRAPERVRDFHARIVPLAFVGARDGSPNVRKTWVDAWEELSGGSNAPLRLWLGETMDLAERLISTSPSWGVKKQVALAIGDMSRILGPAAFEPFMARVVPLLVAALQGRTWDGKEVVVTALGDVVAAGGDWFGKDEGKAYVDSVVKALLAEARKNNKAYKRHGIEALGKALHALAPHVDVYDEIYDDLARVAAPDSADGEKSDEDDDDVRQKPMQLVLRASAFRALGQAFPISDAAQRKHANKVLGLLARQIEGNVWNVRLGVLDAVEAVIKRLAPVAVAVEAPPAGLNAMDVDVVGGPNKGLSDAVDQSTLVVLVWALCSALEDLKYTKIRETAAAVLLRVVPAAASPSASTRLQAAEARALADTLEKLADKEPVSVIAEAIRDIRREALLVATS